MSDLGIIDSYENIDKKETRSFIDNIESSLNVKTETQKTIKDTEWIDKIQETLPYIDNIYRSPNRFIVNEEEIVKIELAKKITVESIKHLSKNTNFIQSIDKKTGDVQPSKILNINKEEDYDTYENRVVYTLIQNIKMFIKNRKKLLEGKLKEEQIDNKTLEYSGDSKIMGDKVGINLVLNSCLDHDEDKSVEDMKQILNRIEELEKNVTELTYSEIYKIIDKKSISLVREPIKKTNVILKNVNFQYAMKLWTYLRDNYDEKDTQINEKQEYNDEGQLKNLIDETFLLQYIALKTLEDDKMENKETREEIKEAMVEQIIDKMIEMDADLTSKQLKEMISEKYEVIKYKKMQAIKEIQKIYKAHIDLYTEKVERKGEYK